MVSSITYWTSTKFVQIMPLGPEIAPPGGHKFYISLYMEIHEKIFLSETIRPRALIGGMYHHLVDLYQVCLEYAPGTKKGPTPGFTCFTYAYIWKNKIFWWSETIRPRALKFGMKHHLKNLYKVRLDHAPWVKNDPALGVTCVASAYIGKA